MEHLFKWNLAACTLLLITCQLQAQDMLETLEKDQTAKKEFTKATFKATRLINQHSVETLGKRSLDFRIAHHFGNFGAGPENFWGLDDAASIRISLEYSFDGRLMGGIGRTSQGKLADAFLKYRLLRQTTDGATPLSITLFSSAYYTLLKDASRSLNGFDRYNNTADRFSYCSQVVLARKFSEAFSFQASPTYLHFNQTEHLGQPNDVWAFALASRLKMTKRSALVLEYTFNFNRFADQETIRYYNPFGIGYELETGGHVFQMFVTNAAGITETQTISGTTSGFENWGFGLGFNISRVFSL